MRVNMYMYMRVCVSQCGDWVEVMEVSRRGRGRRWERGGEEREEGRVTVPRRVGLSSGRQGDGGGSHGHSTQGPGQTVWPVASDLFAVLGTQNYTSMNMNMYTWKICV